MASLIAAHRGYEYQDLLVACRLVDMLLGSMNYVKVDEKLTLEDRFDDLTTVSIDGSRERTQFKHTDNDDRPLSPATFTTDSRGLRLDFVIASCLADRFGSAQDASSFSYRIVLRDSAPVDPALTAVLKPITTTDPGPFISGLGTMRLRFDAVALWSQCDPQAVTDVFSFFSTYTSLTFDDLDWVCQHLVVEVAAPAASADLTIPAPAERLLLNRVKMEVGAETFPNAERTAIDVAAAIISTARAARQGRIAVSAEELLRRAQLRSDFGAVSRAHPVDLELEVLRPAAVQRIVAMATELSTTGGHLILVGPPGQGKSWICQQFLEELQQNDWLTAEHYCYLGDADGERNERVMAENVFGSLLNRLAAVDPSLLAGQRPRFAADEEGLEKTLRRSLASVVRRN